MKNYCRQSCMGLNQPPVDVLYHSDSMTRNISDKIAIEFKSCLKNNNGVSLDRNARMVHFSDTEELYVYQNFSSFHSVNKKKGGLLENISPKIVLQSHCQKSEISVNDVSESVSSSMVFTELNERGYDISLSKMFSKINMNNDCSNNAGIECNALGNWSNSMSDGRINHSISDDSDFDNNRNNSLFVQPYMQNTVQQVPSRWSRFKAVVTSCFSFSAGGNDIY